MDTSLRDKGYTQKERGIIFQRVWHLWLPRKISSMIWLTMAKGLPIGAWCTRIGQEGICNFCNNGLLKTLEHGLMRCTTMQETWNNFKEIRVRSSLPPKFDSWEDILLGEVPQPQNVVAKNEFEWNVGKLCNFLVRTPWDILKFSLLWFIWCQKCERDLKEGQFHLGVAFFWAWQITIQVGIVAWKELHKHKRFVEKLDNLICEFKQGWIYFVRTMGSFISKSYNKYFLPKHMVDHRVGLTIKQHVQASNKQNNIPTMEDTIGEHVDGRHQTFQTESSSSSLKHEGV